MLNMLARLRRDEAGATAIEYALIASLISVAIIAGATAIGNNLVTIFDKIGNAL